MTPHKQIVFQVMALVFLYSQAHSAPLVYQPVNPSFAGNPNNIAILQMGARSATKNVEPEESVAVESGADLIAQQIQNSVLAQLSSQISSQIYGEDATPSGTADLGGGNSISWSTTGSTITVIIIGSDGSTTTLDLPVFVP